MATHLSEDPDNDDDDNYMNRIPVPLARARVGLRYHGRVIAGVKSKSKKFLTDLSCRYCDLHPSEIQRLLEKSYK